MILGVVVNGGMVVHASMSRGLSVCGGAALRPVEDGATAFRPCKACERLLAKRGLGWPGRDRANPTGMEMA